MVFVISVALHDTYLPTFVRAYGVRIFIRSTYLRRAVRSATFFNPPLFVHNHFRTTVVRWACSDFLCAFQAFCSVTLACLLALGSTFYLLLRGLWLVAHTRIVHPFQNRAVVSDTYNRLRQLAYNGRTNVKMIVGLVGVC